MKSHPKHRNILQWRAARAKYEARIRHGSLFALSCENKLHATPAKEAIAGIESVIQFKLKEWEQRNPKPKEV